MEKSDLFIFANSIGGLIEAMGMQAENSQRLSRGESIAYNFEAFNKVMLDRGLYHNSLITELYPR